MVKLKLIIYGILTGLLFFTFCSCKKIESTPPLKIVDFSKLKPIFNIDSDTTYVINFWATWCGPCVKELPYFEKLITKHKNEKLKVILVSLDFPKKYETHLKPFIKKHQLQSELFALNDLDMNTWIPQVDSTWSGAIPATYIYNRKKRQFFEKSFTEEELQVVVAQFLMK